MAVSQISLNRKLKAITERYPDLDIFHPKFGRREKNVYDPDVDPNREERIHKLTPHPRNVEELVQLCQLTPDQQAILRENMKDMNWPGQHWNHYMG